MNTALLDTATADYYSLRPGWCSRRTETELAALLPELDALARNERAMRHDRTTAALMAECARINLTARRAA